MFGNHGSVLRMGVSRGHADPMPHNSEMRQQTLWQIMIGEEVEGCDVQDTVDDGGAGE